MANTEIPSAPQTFSVQLRITLRSQCCYKVGILMLDGSGETREFEIFNSHFEWLTHYLLGFIVAIYIYDFVS